jgi:GntR family transcriptional regulator/MocR family aminotransferase
MRRCPDVRLAYVTPSHQYPLGVTMSLARRLALLEWATRTGAWVLEDDYDSEYRYEGRPLAALQGLDHTGRVIYMGTFSKVLLPALRLGYLVVPPALVDTFVQARSIADRHSPSLDQMILTEFINEGHFARHIRRMKQLYVERQAVLIEAARQKLDGLLQIQPSTTGLHVVGWLPPGWDDRLASQHVQHQGVDTPPLSAYYLAPPQRIGLVLGYAGVETQAIRAAVEHIAIALS